MLNLEDAIKHAEEVAESKEKQVKNGDWEKDSLTERNCIKCADEHRQLAEWLRDYKRLKEQEPCEDTISRQNDILPNIDKKIESYGNLLKHPVVKRIMGIDKEPSENAISRQAVDTLVDELARAISDERCCISRGRSTATIMQDILDLPSVKPQESCDVPDTNVGDIISKQTVLDTISELNAISFYEAQEDSKECYYEIRQAIKDLPPVKLQEPKTGHWITEIKSDVRDDMWPTNPRCSECGGEPYYSNSIHNYKFCPYCGCKMVKPQETKQPEISSYYGLKSYMRERSE